MLELVPPFVTADDDPPRRRPAGPISPVSGDRKEAASLSLCLCI
jgi:hypothetical protein